MEICWTWYHMANGKDTAVLQVILVEASNICFRKLRDQVEIPFLGFSCALLVWPRWVEEHSTAILINSMWASGALWRGISCQSKWLLARWYINQYMPRTTLYRPTVLHFKECDPRCPPCACPPRAPSLLDTVRTSGTFFMPTVSLVTSVYSVDHLVNQQHHHQL